MRLDLAHRSRPYPGETHNGDAVWQGEWNGCPVFAVFDASGHGPEAHDAATIACSVLDRWEGGLEMTALAERLHRELKGSRGSAALIAALD
ncbi:MAG: phosphoserine phosphatase, partial [Deltaproteobacteria bacterium]|nr:phosphoserine phosphatase [Deltaproteobacteria bacterium]